MLGDLLRRDHDDLTIALDLMVLPTTPRAMLLDSRDAIRLAFMVHAVAEKRVLTRLTRREPFPIVHDLFVQSINEHVEQELIIEDLFETEVGTPDWFGLALEMKERLTFHADREELAWGSVRDVVPSRLHKVLAGEYATERMKVLAATNPLALEVA